METSDRIEDQCVRGLTRNIGLSAASLMDVTGLRSQAVHPVLQSVISRNVKHDMTE